jgi:hypothetical protein
MSNLISRPQIPEFATQKELFSFLLKNEKSLIAQKKAFPIKSDDLEFGYYIISGRAREFTGKKADDDRATTTDGELNIEVYANVAGWCDSQLDVMIKDSWNKSINDIGVSGQKLFYHLKNHFRTTDAVVGKDARLFTKIIDPSKVFNINTDVKQTQALMMASTVVRDYDPKCYMLYRDGQIKQHSIGLQYVKLYLCVNNDDADFTQQKEAWDKYFPVVLNKEYAEKKGYFWAVTEAKILETSTVLYGANELTPVNSDNTKQEPPVGTPAEPDMSGANWEKLASIFSNN